MSLIPSAGNPPQLPVVPAAKPVAFPDSFTAPFSTPGQHQVATFKSLPLRRWRSKSPQGQSHAYHMWSHGDLMTRTPCGHSMEPLSPLMRETHPAPGRPSPRCLLKKLVELSLRGAGRSQVTDSTLSRLGKVFLPRVQ